MKTATARAPRALPSPPQERGAHVVYHEDETNRCPACGRSSWHVGRSTAECAFCGAAIPLADVAV